MATIIELDRVPDAASEFDKWIDSFDGRRLYTAEVTYGLTVSTLTLLAVDRPGAVDLVFTALNAGGVGDLIDIIFTNAGPTGTSTLTKTGNGTAESHFIYTFDLFEDNSSNDIIIILLTGDTDLTASGTDATNGTFVLLSSASLVGAKGNWRPVNIHLDYVAELPEIIDPSLDLDRSIPLDIKQSLAEKLASVLLNIDEGGDKLKADTYEITYNRAIARSTKHRSRQTIPNDVIPG